MFFRQSKSAQDYLTDRSYLAGLLTAMGTGIAIGLLIAPRSCRKTRKQIAEFIDDQSKPLQHGWDKTKSKAGNAINNIKSDASHIVHKAQDELDEYADVIEDKADKLSHVAKSGFGDLRNVFR